LDIAYGQLFSMNQLAVLERLAELQGKVIANDRFKQAANSKASNLAGFSLSEDEGSLTFD
jgi:hypothetical protein